MCLIATIKPFVQEVFTLGLIGILHSEPLSQAVYHNGIASGRTSCVIVVVQSTRGSSPCEHMLGILWRAALVTLRYTCRVV
jgi:hypothetical protein